MTKLINRSATRQKSAFTLIELLVVILILAISAALIVPRLISRAGEAKIAKAASDIATLSSALSQFRLDCDRFPTTEEGLDALRTQPSDVKGWRVYLEKPIPADPWGNPYVYEYPGSGGEDTYTLLSYGKDGAPGGEGENQDIGNDEGSSGN